MLVKRWSRRSATPWTSPAARRQRCRVRRGCRLFRRRVPVHSGPAQKFGRPGRVFDTAIKRMGIVGAAVGMAAYGLRPCVEIQFADYMYPPTTDRAEGGAAALPLQRPVHRPAGRAHADRRRPFRRPDAQPESSALFTHVAGLKTVVPLQPLRAQGTLIASIEDQRSGDLSRAQAALQRPRSTAITSGRSRRGRAIRKARSRTAITPSPWARPRFAARALR